VSRAQAESQQSRQSSVGAHQSAKAQKMTMRKSMEELESARERGFETVEVLPRITTFLLEALPCLATPTQA
jgi:hypothetical protein